jgi:hypothetical protein
MCAEPENQVASSSAIAASKIAVQLMVESERGAVLLGSARIDFALEKLLKSIMSPHPDGNDNLFQSDRPLGTFSAKISLAFRLSLIDKTIEHALQMTRKIRNDFAHSFEDQSLSMQSHRNRLQKPIADAQRSSLWPELYKTMNQATNDIDVLNFMILVVILVAHIEAVAQLQSEFKPAIPVRLFI